MSEAIRVDISEIADVVSAANIPEEQKRTAAWCIKQLPELYEQFCRTYESRYGNEIVRLEQGVLSEVSGKSPPGADGQQLLDAVTVRFKALHERLGLPLLNPKQAPRVPARKSRRS
ncbi:MAG: hypothetical protein K2R98_18175 [Gemmataceae bacterium]|nr:hypothetical protein [Gemmataceae bacterium]